MDASSRLLCNAMMLSWLLVLSSSVVLAEVATTVLSQDKCTAIVAGRLASTDGSVFNTYNADCAECDWRINKVPPMDYPEGAERPIYLITGTYPRAVRSDHGATWTADNLEPMAQFKEEWMKMRGEIIGWIPQVSHTYGYIEGLYGIMNEWQVAIGESTCASKLYAAPIGPTGGGTALLEASELSQIALERAKTAKEAIHVMGSLAEKYGFYSADWTIDKYGPAHAMGEGGEALTVSDTTEAWVFHIIPDDTKSSAVWIAQRVPDGHVAVLANQFIIKEVIPGHPDFMYSANLYDVAKRMGWWDDSKGRLNFLETFAPPRYHPNYSNMRVWRIFSLVNPSAKWPALTDKWASDYPFSVPVEADKKLSLLDMLNFNRDHYQGSRFDMEKGLAAGPYGDPNRYDIWSWDNMTAFDALEGEFPRAIGLFRTSYSFVSQARANVPNVLSRLWLNMHNPDTSAFAPLYVHATTMPAAFTRGTFHQYDTTSFWWNACVVANYVSKYYVFAIKSVRTLQAEIHAHLEASVEALELQVSYLLQLQMQRRGEGEQEMIQLITSVTIANGMYVNERYRDFFPKLLTNFRDGFAMDTSTATIGFVRLFYPRWWLEKVGYFDIKGTSGGILFAQSPTSDATLSTTFIILTISFACAIGGYVAGKNEIFGGTGGLRASRYDPIPSPDLSCAASGVSYHNLGSNDRRYIVREQLPKIVLTQV